MESFYDIRKCINVIAVIGMLFFSNSSFGQSEKSLLREGNEHFDQENYENAIQLYQESKAINGSYDRAAFNLGNAFYRSGNLGQASQEFEIAAAGAFEKEDKAKAYHNVGNSFLNAAQMLMKNPPSETDSVQPPDPQQLIQASIEAYKKSLRNNPQDEETRYNLAYAKKMLKEGGGGGGQDQQEQNKDEQEQDQQQDEDQEGDESQEQEKNDQGDQQEEEQSQGEKPDNEMSKQEAEQLLEALDKNEKDLQEKMGKDRVKGDQIKIEKDW